MQEFADDRYDLILVNCAMNSGNVRKAGGRNSANERIIMTSELQALSLRPFPIIIEHRHAHQSPTDYGAIVACE